MLSLTCCHGHVWQCAWMLWNDGKCSSPGSCPLCWMLLYVLLATFWVPDLESTAQGELWDGGQLPLSEPGIVWAVGDAFMGHTLLIWIHFKLAWTQTGLDPLQHISGERGLQDTWCLTTPSIFVDSASFPIKKRRWAETPFTHSQPGCPFCQQCRSSNVLGKTRQRNGGQRFRGRKNRERPMKQKDCMSLQSLPSS